MHFARRVLSSVVLLIGLCTVCAFWPPPHSAYAQGIDAGAVSANAPVVSSPPALVSADGGTASAPASIVTTGASAQASSQVTIPDIDTTQAVGLIEQSFQAIHEGNWWLLAGLLVTLLVLGLHVYSAKLPHKLSGCITSYLGGCILTTLITAAGAVIHAASVGHPANAELLATVGKVFATAFVSYSLSYLRLPSAPAQQSSFAPAGSVH